MKKETRPYQDVGKDGFIRWYTDNGELILDKKKAPSEFQWSIMADLNETTSIMYNEGDEEFAKFLILSNLPENVEEILIAKYNYIKKQDLHFKDKVEQKRKKILQSYR